MIYKPKFKLKIEKIITLVNDNLNNYAVEKDLVNTRTLCRCTLVSIFALIRSSYASLIQRELSGCEVLMRSMIEYTIDLFFIAFKNDKIINSRFSNYHKLISYWRINYIKYYFDQIPRAAAEYKEHVQKNFSEIVKDKITLKDGLVLDKNNSKEQFKYWHEIDKRIRDRYLRHWSGLSFPDRVAKIENILGKEGMSAKDFEYFFKFCSDYSHSSDRSCIPHYDFIRNTFEFEYNYYDQSLAEMEDGIFLIMDYALKGFASALDAKEGKEFEAFRVNLFRNCYNF